MGLIHTVVSAMKAKPQQTEDRVLSDSESLHKRGVTSRRAQGLPGGGELGGRLLFKLQRRSSLWSVLFLAGHSGLQQLCTFSPVNTDKVKI